MFLPVWVFHPAIGVADLDTKVVIHDRVISTRLGVVEHFSFQQLLRVTKCTA